MKAVVIDIDGPIHVSGDRAKCTSAFELLGKYVEIEELEKSNR